MKTPELYLPRPDRLTWRYSLRALLVIMFLAAILAAGIRYQWTAAPDLVITAVTFTPAQPKVGEGVQPTIFYRNVGRKAAANFDLYQSEPISLGWGLGGSVLKAGEKAKYLWGGVGFTKPGRYKFVFSIDGANTVAEANESNNAYTIHVDVGEAMTSHRASRN